jgi:predicted Zn-dependent protease
MRGRGGAFRIGPVAALLATLVGGCITPSQEAQLGEEAAKDVEREMGLVRDPALEGYVRAVGEKLAAVSDRSDVRWKFFVVDVPDPNAFALPGGFVYVTRGLLVLANSEDELAGVIGHEMGHVTARHAVKRAGAGLATAPITLATGLAGLALGIVSPILGSVVSGTGQILTGGLVLAPFSREQEHEADEIGQELAARAGYDPAGISTFLRTLDREVALLGRREPFHFLSSHPITPDRVERTTRGAAELERAASGPIAHNRSDFLRRLEGIVVGDDPAQGVFEENRFLHPEFDLALDFPAGWETHNTAAAAGALSPAKDALVALRFVDEDTSLDAVVEEAQEKDPDLDFERFEIRGLPAARTEVSGRGQVARVILIGYGGRVFAIVGQSRMQDAAGYARAFDATARSFRALRQSERAALRESRLRVRAARSGETPEAIARRTGSTWSAERVAIANAVELESGLQGGQEVKLALPQAYTPRRR